MAKKEYDNDDPVTMASDPAVAYVASSAAPPNMTTDEYFEKVREALDNRYDAESLEDLLDQIEAQNPTPPPCQYTVEEAVQRVLQATADVDAGRGLVSHEEFKKQVRPWLN